MAMNVITGSCSIQEPGIPSKSPNRFRDCCTLGPSSLGFPSSLSGCCIRTWTQAVIWYQLSAGSNLSHGASTWDVYMLWQTPGQVSTILLLIQPPAIALEKQCTMTHVHEFLPLTRETRMKSLVPGFNLALPWLLHSSGEWIWIEDSLSISLSLFSVCINGCLLKLL